MNVIKHMKSLLILSTCTMAVGCKVQVISPTGGEVAWSAGSCAAGTVCDIEISDGSFNESFTAIPADGYIFVRWQDGSGMACADSTDPVCTVSLEGYEEEAGELLPLYLYERFSLMPVYSDVGVDSDGDGEPDRTDEDDDNDTVFDVDDQCPGTAAGEPVDEFGCSEEQQEPNELFCENSTTIQCGYDISEADWISSATEDTLVTIPQGKILVSKFKTSDSTTSYGRFQFQTPPGYASATATVWVSLTPGGAAISARCSRGPAVKTYSFTWTQFANNYCTLDTEQVYFLNMEHSSSDTASSSIVRDVVTSSQ